MGENNTSGKRTLIKRSVLEEAKAKLKELPKAEPEHKEEMFAKEAVEELKLIIREMRTEKGYTLAQVAKHLEECGIKIGESTLQYYLRESGSRKRRRTKKAGDVGAPNPTPVGAATAVTGEQDRGYDNEPSASRSAVSKKHAGAAAVGTK
jgi:hypothetical protein